MTGNSFEEVIKNTDVNFMHSLVQNKCIKFHVEGINKKIE